MRIAVSASIVTDHLMVFASRFAEQLIIDKVDRPSLSFLADRLEVRQRGVAANFGLGRLGLLPVLIGAAGVDLAETHHRANGLDLVLVGADDPEAMLRHTATAHEDIEPWPGGVS